MPSRRLAPALSVSLSPSPYTYLRNARLNMGNCPGCLSSHGSSVHDHPNEEDAELITIVRITDGELFQYAAPVFVKDLMSGFHGFAVFSYANKRGTDKPLHPDTQLSFNTRYHLKPFLRPSIKPQIELANELHLQSSALRQQQEAAERSLKKPKISKKVRFADEHVPISSCNQELKLSSNGNGELQYEELSCVKQSPIVMDASNRSRSSYIAGVDDETTLPQMRKGDGTLKVNGVVRLKVRISKKDLTELLSPKTTDMQAEAMVERVIAPLLSPQYCSTNTCSQTL